MTGFYFIFKAKEKNMSNKILISILMIVSILFPLISYADEYNRDEAFNPWKLMAYALYPAGYTIETVIVKPGHWILSLPFLRDISGHDELSKSLLPCGLENNFQSYENIKSFYHETKSHAEEPEKSISDNENLASKGKEITDNANIIAIKAKTAAAKAKDSASRSEDAAIKAEEAAERAELAAKKAEAIFNKQLQK